VPFVASARLIAGYAYGKLMDTDPFQSQPMLSFKDSFVWRRRSWSPALWQTAWHGNVAGCAPAMAGWLCRRSTRTVIVSDEIPTDTLAETEITCLTRTSQTARRSIT
jgi:hypothetical protein